MNFFSGHRRLCLSAISAAALMVSALTCAVAGPPFTTDNPQPVPTGEWQIFVLGSVNTGHGSYVAQVPYVEADYGRSKNLQYHLSMPLLYNSPRSGHSYFGPGDFDFALKYRFVQEDAKTPMVGIYPHINLPTGNYTEGLGAGHVQLFLPVWLQKSVGKWKYNAGGGYFLNPGEKNRDYWVFGGLAQHDLNNHLTVGGEVFYNSATKVGAKEQVDFRIALDYHRDPNHHLFVALGRSIIGDNDLLATAGVMWYTK